MAQVAGVWVGKTVPNSKGKLMFLASVEEAKFRKPVVPGDQLRIEMTLEKSKQTVVKMKGAATVDGQVGGRGDCHVQVDRARSGVATRR